MIENPYKTTSQHVATVPLRQRQWSYRRSAKLGFLATAASPFLMLTFTGIYQLLTVGMTLTELGRGLIILVSATAFFGGIGVLLGMMTSLLGRLILPSDEKEFLPVEPQSDFQLHSPRASENHEKGTTMKN